MDTLSFPQRLITALRRRLAIVVSLLRQLVSGLLQLVVHNQLTEISEQTQRLGSASVESITYLGGELRALDERLSAIERELSALRALLDPQSSSTGDSDEVTAGSPRR